MGRNLFIVTREQPGLYAYVQRDFRQDADVEVIMDRRVGERRRSSEGGPDDRRRSDRRVRQEVAQQLAALGFAIVHADEPAAAPPRPEFPQTPDLSASGGGDGGARSPDLVG